MAATELTLRVANAIGEITADTEPPKGLAVEQKRLDETEIGQAKVVTITEVGEGGAPERLPAALGLSSGHAGLLDHEVFESIYNPGKLVLLASWRDADAANAWRPVGTSVRHRQVRIIRDYGMFERREAPQYYPEVKRLDGETLGAADERQKRAAG